MDGIGMYNNALVADDERAICDVIKKILEKRGYCVTTTHKGQQAEEILKRNEFNLIFLDYIMPGLKGCELIQLAREKNPEATIVVISGRPTADRRIADDLGANTFLQKPLSVGMIEDIVGGIQ